VNLIPVQSQTGNDRNREFVKRVKMEHEETLFQMQNVYAVGIGKEGDRYVIDVYGDPAMRPHIPTKMEGVTIRFNDSGPFYATAAAQVCDNKATFSPPIPIGFQQATLPPTQPEPLALESSYLFQHPLVVPQSLGDSATLLPTMLPPGLVGA
jgi:hypothetical protein